MKKNYKLVLQYDGTRYDGWQKQGNTKNTIQEKLEAVLERMTGQETEVHGSGRTDAGVHALAQTANFHGDIALKEDEIKDYLNRYLPEDIRVRSVEEAAERFHSRLNAVSKTYLYRIETTDKKDVFERKYIYGFGKELDIRQMERAAEYLLGEHDFKSFCANSRMKKSTVRRVDEITVTQQGTKVLLRFTGNGFLYYMVRIMAGTLMEVGIGKRKPEEIERIIAAQDRQEAGFTAPPEGLFLESVRYENSKR